MLITTENHTAIRTRTQTNHMYQQTRWGPVCHTVALDVHAVLGLRTLHIPGLGNSSTLGGRCDCMCDHMRENSCMPLANWFCLYLAEDRQIWASDCILPLFKPVHQAWNGCCWFHCLLQCMLGLLIIQLPWWELLVKLGSITGYRP